MLLKPIIKSILDTDMYKLTMQQAVLLLYPKVVCSYVFNNRNKLQKFSDEVINEIKEQIEAMAHVALRPDEEEYLKNLNGTFRDEYVAFLKDYRFNPKNVIVSSSDDGVLEIKIIGRWVDTILWEVPLMAIVAECYYSLQDTAWKKVSGVFDTQKKLIEEKAQVLGDLSSFAEYGTRRRRCFEIQDLVVENCKNKFNFYGTSNVLLAKKHNVKPIGTQGHEWTMAHSVLCSLKHANRYAMESWTKIYNKNLIALPDTFGTYAFLRDFDDYYSRLFDGVRQDSGSPYDFIDRFILHYQSKGIDPNDKVFSFSDSLNKEKCKEIKSYLSNKHKVRKNLFCIGTNLTNDFSYINSPALNIVVKLSSIDNTPVVKISDDVAKAIGDKDAMRVAMWTFFQKPLDAA